MCSFNCKEGKFIPFKHSFKYIAENLTINWAYNFVSVFEIIKFSLLEKKVFSVST